MKIIVNLTAWRRPKYFEETIAALQKCYGFKEFSYRVIIDGGYPYQQRLMKEIVSRRNFNCELIFHEKRIGCAGSVGSAFLSSFDDHNADAVIMLEDDTVPSRDFLVYMKDMLIRYADDEDIWSVTGYNRRVYKANPESSDHHFISIGKGQGNKIFSRKSFTKMGGWGTWARCRNEIGDNWFGIHWNHKDKKTENACPRGSKFLDYVIKDNTGSWAWPMCMYWRRDRKEIVPDLSRIQNIGEEGGMFAPGGDWHKKNHHSEIWMDNIHFIPSEKNSWIAEEWAEPTEAFECNTSEVLIKKKSKFFRELNRIFYHISLTGLSIVSIFKRILFKLLILLESIYLHFAVEYQNQNIEQDYFKSARDAAFEKVASFLGDLTKFNAIDLDAHSEVPKFRDEYLLGKLFSVNFNFSTFFKNNKKRIDTSFCEWEIIGYSTLFTKKFKEIGLIYSFSRLLFLSAFITRRIIKKICEILSTNGIGIILLPGRQQKIIELIQKSKCTIVEILEVESSRGHNHDDLYIYIFRRNR